MYASPDANCERRLLAQQAALEPEGAAPPALARHLRSCADCRAEFEETRDMVTRLAAALGPQPLPDALRTRLHASVAARSRAPAAGRRVGLRVAAAALAASLLGAILYPGRPAATRSPTLDLALTRADAAVITAAVARYGWESPLDYSSDLLLARVRAISEQLQESGAASSALPWDQADDWDRPSRPG